MKSPFRIGFIVLFLLAGCAGAAYGQANPDSLWSYRTIISDTDGDSVLDYDGQQVKISGVANVASGLLHETYLQIFVQTDSSGLSLFSMKIDEPVSTGDSIVATGKVEKYFGLAEVHVESYRVIKNVGEPRPLFLEEVMTDTEKYIGMLVAGEGEIMDMGHQFNGSYFIISPENSDGTMMIYLSNFHSMYASFNFDLLSVGDKVSIKGVLSEYSPNYPSNRTHKIFLRTPEDLQSISFPQYYTRLLLMGFVALAVFGLGWVFALRKRVDSKTKEIQLSLYQKELLLKEIHHRVKNSLSIVSGLIEIQLSSTENREATHILQDCRTRIQSVAMIHEKLYKTESLSDIDLDYYIKDLVESIHGTFTEVKDSVDLQFDLTPIKLDTDRAVYSGLLMNELVVNAFKYAFSSDKQGTLAVELKKENNEIILRVSDNGPGLPDNFNTDEGDSLGTILINTFAANLSAAIEVSDNDNNGTSFQFRFPHSQRS